VTTLAIAPDRYTFDGTDLSSYAYLLSTAGDHEDLPGLRGEDVAVPYLPGRRYAAKLPDSRRLSLAFLVTDQAVGGGLTLPDGRQQFQANLDGLRLALAKPGRKSLVHYLPGGSSRTAQAECLGLQVGEMRGNREGTVAVADFMLADPYFYGANVVDSARAISASPTAFTFTHPGTARTNRVAFDFLGPISNPRITNVTNGLYVECLVTVASAKHLIVDCDLFTAANDGVSAIGSIRHSGDFRWMILEPGANSLSVTATSPGGTLTTTAAAPYHG
jgi:hypothetical protein